MYDPYVGIGFFATWLKIDDHDDFGNDRVMVQFVLHRADGSRAGFSFFHYYSDSDGSGIVTSYESDQRLNGSLQMLGGEQYLQLSDARLMTRTPATIPVDTHRVRLYLGGYNFAEGDVKFEAPLDSFDLDGIWTAVP